MFDNISFANAPLVEIVAEMRWNPVGSEGAPDVLNVAVGGADADEFILALNRQAALEKFSRSERLLPAGFPAQWGQPTWRFRDPTSPHVLVQAGPGAFVVNALPPYKRWADFRPELSSAIHAMLRSRPEKERGQNFSALHLRYINVFGPDLLDNREPINFARDVLNFKVAGPAALARSPRGFRLNLNVPYAEQSKVMNLVLGDAAQRTAGSPQPGPHMLLDFTVSEETQTSPDLEAILTRLDASRNIIHSAFLGMTSTIHARMRPDGGNQ